MRKYTIGIFFSEEDEGYIAVVPELPGCSAFGETEEEALQEIKVALQLRLEVEHAEEKKEVISETFDGDYLLILATRVNFESLQVPQGEEQLVYEYEEAVTTSGFA